MSDFVLVKVCESRLEADIWKSYLEAEGIQVIIQADDAGGMLPTLTPLSGARLFVPKEDFSRAQEFMSERK